VKKHLPEPFTARIVQLKKHCGSTMMRYVRSLALILLITFSELALGLTLLHTERPLLRAAGIAAFDLLPILGCGGVLIPWGIVALLGGDMRLGIGLLVLWAVIALVRSIIEPRIVGRQMGVHPLITLAAIFIGGKLFGFAGMLFLPIAAGVAASVLAAPQE
jgi:predicted PurR-regulated permease PerM